MDEYISRHDALLHSEIIRVYSKDYGNIDVVPVEYLADIPTADVQPAKYGKWIIDYAEGRKIYHAHCSECGKEPTRNIGGDYYIDKLSDFCPNCGSKNRMDGDSE